MEVTVSEFPLAASDDDFKEEKAYVDFYKSNETNNYENLRKMCSYLLNFVCNEPAEKQLLISKGDYSNGWCTELHILSAALEYQLERADGRLRSLQQMYKLLLNSQKESTVLTCVHQQLLTGFFGLCSIKNDDSCTQLHHYLELIEASPIHMQEKIRESVHNIHKVLVSSLDYALEYNVQNKHLQLLTIFALSTRYQPSDLSLVIENDLMNTLMLLYNYSIVPNHVITKSQIVNVAALRLIHILAMSCCIHSKKVDSSTVKKVIQKMYDQLISILDNKPENLGNLSPNALNRFKSNYDRILGDYLVFLRTIASTSIIQKHLSTQDWTDTLLFTIGTKDDSLLSLRPKLLMIQLLQTIFPGLKPSHITKEHRITIIEEILKKIAKEMWNEPLAVIEEKECSPLKHFENACDLEENVPVHDMGFDPKKMVNCTIHCGLTLVHAPGGRGYGLGVTAIKSGCYQWKILIVNENKGNEGTCIGVSKYPVKDYSHRTTSDMWLYRAYSGSLYHNGETDLCLESYTQGDYIIVVLDMNAKTLSFGKNGEEPVVAFENIDATELYPCVMFYSTNPGEKVKITDMQVIIVFNLKKKN